MTKTKMATSFSPFLKSSLKRLAGLKERLSTLISSEIGSSSEKSNDPILTKLNEVLKEREALHVQIKKLQEDIRLLQERFNPEYDV